MSTENTNKKHELLLYAYSLLCDVTPKKYDCGMLCGSACCKENTAHGTDGESGMLLLPGEKELLCGTKDFKFVKSDEGELLVCDGSCVRELRPFACRMFPFYPHIETCGGRYIIKIKPDPRASVICPVFSDFRKRKTHAEFLRNAKKAVRTLLADDDIAKELCSQSDMISDIEKLRGMLLKGLR